MDIATEADLNGPAAVALREARGESQEVFWSRVGISQSGGWRYEKGTPIPRYVRIPLFAIYVAGIDLDASTADGVAALKRLASLQHSDGAGERAARMQEAITHIRKASKLLAD